MKATSAFFIAMCFVIACCSAAESNKDQKKEKFTPTPSELQTMKSSTVESTTTEAMHKDLQMAQQNHQSTQTRVNQRGNPILYENIYRRPDITNQKRAASNSPVSPRQRFLSQHATTETTVSALSPQANSNRKHFSKNVQTNFQSDYKTRIPLHPEQTLPVHERRQQNIGRNVAPMEYVRGVKESHSFNAAANQPVYPESQLFGDEMSVFGRRDTLKVRDGKGNEGKMLKGQEQFHFGNQQLGAQMPHFRKQQAEFPPHFNPYGQEVRNQEQYHPQEQQVKGPEQSYHKGTEFSRNQQQSYDQQQRRGQPEFVYRAQGEEFNRQQTFSAGLGQQESFDQYYNPQQQARAHQELTKQQSFSVGFDQQVPQGQYYQQQQARSQDFYPQDQTQFPSDERYLRRKENAPIESYQPARDEFVYESDYKSNERSADSRTRFQEAGKEQFPVQPVSRRAFLDAEPQDGTHPSSAKNPMSVDRDMSFLTEKMDKEYQEQINKQVQTNSQSFQENSPESTPISNHKGSNILPESRSLSETVVLTGIQSLPVHPALIYNTGEIPSSHAVVVSRDSVAQQEGGASVRHHLQTPHVQYIYRHPL